ncbi:MAG: GNAT family N-acetyltransferase [Candidatus Thorarchaeota archaeon]|jgi:ribosomal protein S18 acetylase RimI-like enzyme
MTIQMRSYHWDDDFDRARRFLGELYFIQNSHTSWLPTTLENVKFGPGGTEYLDEEDEYLKIWEDGEQIVAFSVTKPSGSCHLSIHPEYIAHASEIILWMQKRVKELSESDSVKMTLVIDDADEELIQILSDLGFKKDEIEGDNQIRPLDSPILGYSLPDGYSVRHADIANEFEEYKTVQVAVFPHIKSMSKKLLDTYSKASFYQKELDIVAVAPSGEFAAFCTARIDPISKITELEPVGTHPDHRKLGLGKAVLLESFKRLEKYKPTAVVILGAAPSEGARRLYESVGFVNEGKSHFWAKLIN